MNYEWSSLKLDPRITQIIHEKFKFPRMTPVQAASIPLLMKKKDVTVEAVTGSGKSLAFILPVIQIVLDKREEMRKRESRIMDSHDVVAIVVSPTIELAKQSYSVLSEFVRHDDLKEEVKAVHFVGGSKAIRDEEKYVKFGGNVIVSTPGRLAELLEKCPQLRLSVRRHLELLILDEADQLLSMGFETTINEILKKIPKQRRTCLFSATQTKQLEQLIRAGLRNPVRVEVKAKNPSVTAIPSVTNRSLNSTSVTNRSLNSPSATNHSLNSPSATNRSLDSPSVTNHSLHETEVNSTGLQMSPFLNNYYIILESYASKLSLVINFILNRAGCKTLIFFSTCAQVDYFSTVIDHFVQLHSNRSGCINSSESNSTSTHSNHSGCIKSSESNSTSISIFKIHRKLRRKRGAIFAKFTQIQAGVLLCTDLMARGIDIKNVDWVIHFDLPNTLQHYIHRSGRSGHQVGQSGNSLLLIQKHEEPFLKLCMDKNIDLNEIQGNKLWSERDQEPTQDQVSQMQPCEQKKNDEQKRKNGEQKKKEQKMKLVTEKEEKQKNEKQEKEQEKKLLEGKEKQKMELLEGKEKQETKLLEGKEKQKMELLEGKEKNDEMDKAENNEQDRSNEELIVIQDSQITKYMKDEARQDCSFYEAAMTAFVSFIRTYSSKNVLSQVLFDSLDVISLVNDFGLLKIPIMPELRSKLKSCPSTFLRQSGDRQILQNHLSSIKGRKKIDGNDEEHDGKKKRTINAKLNRKKMRKKIKETKLQGKRKKALIDELEFNELADDFRMIKKLKKRKITQQQFDEHFSF